MPEPILERDFNTEQRKEMADKGTAMPDGSYPISNREDLANAISSYGRASDPAAVKRHIIKRARALGAVSALPDDWGVTESAIVESGGSAVTTTAAGGKGRFMVQLISPGWGSSGYYSPDVLREAAANRVIPAGTHMYADHPTAEEDKTRPERSIKDLMAVTTSDARLMPNGALAAEVQVLSPYRELVNDAKDAIGVSIRGSATDTREGVAEGRRGRIIEGLAKIKSVDFVTRAGRGGKVMELLESARDVDDDVELDEADRNTITDLMLSEALAESVGSATHPGDTERLMSYWAHGEGAAKIGWGAAGDYDKCLVELGKYVRPDEVHGLCQNLHIRATGAPAGHAPGEAHESARPAGSTGVPATRPDGTRKGATMPKIEIEESEHTRLTETAGRVATLEAEKRTWEAERSTLQADLAEANKALIPNKDLREALANVVRENAILRAREVAAPMIAEALEDALIGKTAKSRLAVELLDGIALKEAEEGRQMLDTAALTEAINTKVRVAEAEAEELREAMGVGRPRGLGRPGGGVLVEQKVAEYTDKTAGALAGAFGLTESAAKTAATGR